MGGDLTPSDGLPNTPAPLKLGTAESVALIARIDGEHACITTPDHFGHDGADLSITKRGAGHLGRWLLDWARPKSKLVLWGLNGIAQELRVSRATAYNWSRRRDFPAPVKVTGGNGQVWEAAAVKAWAKLERPTVGRPKKQRGPGA